MSLGGAVHILGRRSDLQKAIENTFNTPGGVGYKAPGTFTYTYITEANYNYLSSNPTTNNRYGYRFLERGPDAASKLAYTARQINPERGERSSTSARRNSSSVHYQRMGKGYKAYGVDVPGVPGAVDQSHIYRTMYNALTALAFAASGQVADLFDLQQRLNCLF